VRAGAVHAVTMLAIYTHEGRAWEQLAPQSLFLYSRLFTCTLVLVCPGAWSEHVSARKMKAQQGPSSGGSMHVADVTSCATSQQEQAFAHRADSSQEKGLAGPCQRSAAVTHSPDSASWVQYALARGSFPGGVCVGTLHTSR